MYQTNKDCERCEVNFKANSNAQLYCIPCRKEIRNERNSKYQSDYYLRTKDAKLEYSTTYNKSEKGKAAEKLRAAVRSGKIKRQPCEICQKPNAEGHHFDYSKPLEVKWLCRTHHAQTHLYEPWQLEMREAGYEGGFLLGELIEACGDEFQSLLKFGDIHPIGGIWEAYSTRGYKVYGLADTPEEAVAKLWLELNKK